MYEINGKVALVTGGASGIGLSCVKEFLKNGAKGIILVDLDDEKGMDACESLNKEYLNRVHFVKANVADNNEFSMAFQEALDKFSGVDIVVNNAGMVDEDKWELTISVNLTGVINGTLLAINEYFPKSSTSERVILNVSSIMGFRKYSFAPIYSATKYGVLGFSRSLDSENFYKKNKIRILTICPGWTFTSLIKQGGASTINMDQLVKETIGMDYQKPDVVGKAMTDMIKTGGNGDIWVVENNQKYKLLLPTNEEFVMSPIL